MGLKATETAACGGLADEPPLRDYNSYGNGTAADAEADRVIAEIASGDRCGGCAILFDGEDAEQVGERWYHRTPECAGAARAKAPPPPKPKRKRRIKGADTTPNVKEMPE
jgi:hypothetical protein